MESDHYIAKIIELLPNMTPQNVKRIYHLAQRLWLKDTAEE